MSSKTDTFSFNLSTALTFVVCMSGCNLIPSVTTTLGTPAQSPVVTPTLPPIPTEVPTFDSTASLNQLIQAAAASQTKIAKLDPTQNYGVTGQLSIPDGVTLDGGGGATLSTNNPNALSWMDLIFISGNNVTIQNLNLNLVFANSNSPGAGIALGSNVSGTTINQVRMQGSNVWAGIYLGSFSMQNILIENNIFTGIGAGVLLSVNQVQTSLSQGSSNITIQNNQMNGLTGDGVEINSPVAASIFNATGNPQFVATNINVLGNRISGSFFGVSVAGAKNVTIKNNSIKNASYNGIHIEDTAANIDIENNTIQNVLAPTSTYFNGYIDGIWMDHCTGITILNNTISNAINSGIDVVFDTPLSGAQYANYSYANNIVIAGNTLLNPGFYGIKAGGGGVSDNFQEFIGANPTTGLTANTYIGATNNPICTFGSPGGITITDPFSAVQCQ